MLMAKSLDAYVPVDLPALSIENYHIALNMPGELKMNWQAYLKALQRLDEATMKVTNANLNFPAHYSLKSQTYLKIIKSLVNLVRPRTYQLSPNVGDRSWPLVKEAVIQPGRVQMEINNMLQKGKILDLGILDVNKARRLFELTRSDKEDHAVFLNQLLTIEKALLKYL